MATPTLEVRPRVERGKNACRRLRAAGRVPANIYGVGSDPIALTLDSHDLRMLLRKEGESGLVTVRPEGQSETTCVFREIQREPISGAYLHVDLLRIDMTALSNFSVEVIGTGQPAGVREGGILETHARAVEVRCLPANLPHAIEIDLTNLGFHQTMHAGDLKLPEGVTLHSDPGLALFSVVVPRGIEEVEAQAAAEGEEVAEPELVTKKKEAEAEAEEEA